MLKVTFENLCPVCKKDLEVDEIEENLCKKENKKISYFSWFKEYEKIEELFKKVINSSPKSIQRAWIKRVAKKESFCVVAPTGIGKTSFGIVTALYFAHAGKKSYIILPTVIMVREVHKKLISYISPEKIVCYHGGLKKEEKKDTIEKIKNGDFSLLITTFQFLAKNFAVLEDKVFDFIFIDDVDSILKASRNVERVLKVIGFEKKGKQWRKRDKQGILVVSTATVKKGKKALLLRDLLGLDVGSSRISVRNVEDIYSMEKKIEKVKEIMKKMGKGGIVYVSTEEEMKNLVKMLSNDYRIGTVTARSKKDFELFKKGELDFLIGTSYYYGTLVRGLDLPEKIRYAIFYGACVFKIHIKNLEDVSDGVIRILFNMFKDDEELKNYVNIKKHRDEIVKRLKEIFKNPPHKNTDLVIKENEIIIPDIRTYLQASGRTSRLTVHGLTKGVSFLLEDNIEILKAFIRRASYYDIEFKQEKDVDFERLKKEIDETRERVIKKIEEEIKPVLFVVESPTKARQIARFFGQPAMRIFKENDEVELIAYEISTDKYIITVTASLGHITDLTTGRGIYGVEKQNGNFIPVYASIKKCKKCGYQYTKDGKCPVCGGESKDSKKRIEILQNLAFETENVIIGTDPDTEGEKIAWDVMMLTTPFAKSIKRAEFHEVTRRAIQDALENLREINENTVKAQIVRRIEDRWFGFKLSEKVQEKFKDKNLSAGRAQTPVLGWIIHRCDEHRKKVKIGIVKELGIIIEKPSAEKIKVKVEKVKEDIEERTPPPPYTTDSMLQDTNTYLKMNTEETMRIAQELFENGFITYHRTDSTRVSERGMHVAKEFLKNGFYAREWKKEGAHECIRPTRPLTRRELARLIYEGVFFTSTPITRKHLALYDLIFRRFMASQAEKAKVKKINYKIKLPDKEIVEERIVSATGKSFELYRFIKVQPELPIGEREVEVIIKKIPRAPLYSQSDVIGLMKEKGIGRPSTYSQILNKLFIRRYIFEKNSKLIASKRGRIVYRYLFKNYAKFVSEDTTRELERIMDMIEEGKEDYSTILEKLYGEISEI